MEDDFFRIFCLEPGLWEGTVTSETLDPASLGPDTLISVVIPSRQRAGLLVRAIRSVLQQKRNHLEIIVVLDGDTEHSAELLRRTFHPGLPIRILDNQARAGAAAARNQGVAAARGRWIAFLDDDDEWLPGKLDKQMECALHSSHANPIVSCQSIARAAHADKIWPKSAPSFPLSEYLFVRKGLLTSSGVLLNSTLLAPRGLLLQVPFTNGLPRYQDADWALRASTQAGVGFEFVAEPLVCWHIEDDGRERISDFNDWRHSLRWAQSLGPVLTPRAYASFLLTQLTRSAARSSDWRGVATLFQEAIRNGAPTASDVVLSLTTALVMSFRVTRLMSQLLLQDRAHKALGNNRGDERAPWPRRTWTPESTGSLHS